MTKLLVSLPLSDAAQKYYGSSAPTYNKAGDAGIDLPFISTAQPYDIQIPQTLMRLDFGTIFAMYDSLSPLNLAILGKKLKGKELLSELGYILTNNDASYASPYPCHFSIRPRSSIDKTPYRLSNSVGTIDKEYRGLITNFPNQPNRKIGYPDILEADTIKASLDYFPWFGAGIASTAYLNFGDRLLQIVAPNLDDILWVRLDFTEENCMFWSEVIGNKSRGGFGSSGR